MLLYLAMNGGNGYVSLKEIAERQNISKKYLEQIVPLLSKSGLLKTNRGYQGGYMLARPAKDYTVGEILRITEGSLAPVACLDTEINYCERQNECITLPLWNGLYKAVTDYLDSVTLQDLLLESGMLKAESGNTSNS